LIIEEVDHLFDSKIFAISLSVSKAFLVRQFFDDYSNGIMEVFNGE
jgi:hypothetical protein